MNIFSKYFKRLTENPHEVGTSTAKEKQSIFIKEYLKPALKQNGYLIKGQTWWKEEDEFYKIINLQNFSFNTKNDVTFCFNLGIGLKNQMKDPSQKPTYANLNVHTREDWYLSEPKKEYGYRNETGYILKQNTDIDNFIKELKNDFENDILPKLKKLVTLKDCLELYGDIPFWGNRLKEMVEK